MSECSVNNEARLDWEIGTKGIPSKTEAVAGRTDELLAHPGIRKLQVCTERRNGRPTNDPDGSA